MEGHALPHGATGIEGDDFAIEFRGDKVVFVAKSAGPAKHYTLEAGFKTGVIDLHETQDVPDGQERHRTLFAMRRDELAALLSVASPMIPELLSLVRPLRLGWLKHRNIGIARGLEPVSDADIAAVTRKRRKRLTLDADLYEKNVFVPEYLLSLLRPLRLGWLKHRNIGIARGLEPVSDTDIAAVTRKRRKRLTLDTEAMS